MYLRNAASPERVAIGPVVQISDGAVQTSGVSVKVLPQGGTASAGSGTIAYEEGIVHYTPIQADTNYTSFILIAYKTGCIPASVTVATDPGDTFARLGAPAGASIAADVATRLAASSYTAPPSVTAVADEVQTRTIAAVTAVGTVVALGANAIDAAAISSDAGAEIADAILNRDMSVGTDSGSPSVRTVRQALRALRNKWTNAAGTYTVYKEDDSTTSWTSTIATTAGADPITGSDPA